MAAERMNGRADALGGRGIVIRASRLSTASPRQVWDVLADLRTHLAWGGGDDPKKGRLLSMDAPEPLVDVGTEFASTGEDRMCRMRDRSVVTEAGAPRVLEFVTDSALELKRGGASADWTVVHRYEIEPDGSGSRITHSYRVTRASDLPGPLGMLRIPILRSLLKREFDGEIGHGLRRLVEAIEAR